PIGNALPSGKATTLGARVKWFTQHVDDDWRYFDPCAIPVFLSYHVSQTHLHLRRRLALIAPPEGCGCNTISNASEKVKSIRRNRTAKRTFYSERVRRSVDHLVENKLRLSPE